MSNMSYCRFQNTAPDLRDCVAALEGIINDPSARLLSRDEEVAAEWMEDLCRKFLQHRANMPREEV